MTQALTMREATAVTVQAEQIDLIRRTVAKDATPDELQLYFYDCARQGVHPLDKLIHFTKRGGKYVPITAIDFMRMRANQTGAYAGSDDAVFTGVAGQKGFAAGVTVYRLVQGQRCAWSATARWEEYFPGEQQGHMWRKMPNVMLAKCAEALALRKAFADVLHGLYIREEMDQATEKPAKDTRGLREKLGVVVPEHKGSGQAPLAQPEEPAQSPPVAALPPPQTEPVKSPLIYPFGQHKGESITDVPDESLQYWMDRIEKDLLDDSKKKFWAKGRRELEQLRAEMDRRVTEAFADESAGAIASEEEFREYMDPPAEELTLQ